jgi:hypothetical protein
MTAMMPAMASAQLEPRINATESAPADQHAATSYIFVWPARISSLKVGRVTASAAASLA